MQYKAVQIKYPTILWHTKQNKTKLTVIVKVKRIVASDQSAGVRVNYSTSKRLIVDDVKTLSLYTNNLPILNLNYYDI